MQDFAEEVEVQQLGCKIIAAHKRHKNRQNEWLSCGALPLILQAMDHFVHDPQLQRDACLVLGKFGKDNHKLRRFIMKGEPGPAPRILRVLDNHLNDSETCTRAIRAIANLASVDVNLWFQLDTVPKIIRIMDRYPRNEFLQERCVMALANLASQDTDVSARVNKLLELGAVERICRAMRENPENRGIQKSGFLAINYFGLVNEPETFEKLAVGGVGPAIARAIDIHGYAETNSRNQSMMQESVFGRLLDTTKRWPKVNLAFMNNGLGEALLSLMADQPQDYQIQRNVLRVFLQLAKNNNTSNACFTMI